VRSVERPVAAKYAPTVALRPDVEKCGLVLPSRNRPHSGWPLEPQPFGSLISPKTSPQPMGLSGHPSASAIGLGMASTSGDCAIIGSLPSGTSPPLSPLARRCLSSATHDADAGVQTAGCGPSFLTSHPVASASSAAPEAFVCTTGSAHLPSKRRSDLM
jgi:hypothetical protein